MVRRFHPDYQLETVLLRAGVHAMGRLSPSLDREHKDLSRLSKALERLDEVGSNRVTGRQMFWKALHNNVQADYRARGETMPLTARKDVARRHAQFWATLDAETQGRFHAMAQDYAASKEVSMASAREEVLAALRVARLRATEKEVTEGSGPLTLSACQLSEGDWARWQELYEGLRQDAAGLKQRRGAARKVPEPLTEEETADLNLMPIRNGPEAAQARPPWVSPVCLLRQQLRTAVLIFMLPGGGNVCMKLLYCKQNPL
eukprot:2085565-Lingulodinium_polyedra.AAC.1